MSRLVKTRLNTSNLMKAQRLFQSHSKQKPAENLNRTVDFVLQSAQRITPYVTTNRIDSELSVSTTRRISRRTGKPVSMRTRNPNEYAVTEGGMATRITLARLWRNSRYNILTDRKYWLPRMSFSPGGGVAGFWKKIEETAKRMVKGRHSSTHFFEHSWSAIREKLRPYLPPRYRSGNVALLASQKKGIASDIGDAVPAIPGTLTPSCTISNRIGMDPTYPTIASGRNAAAHRILEPVLQIAINLEFEKKMIEAERRGWLEDKPALEQLGFKVQ